MAPLASNYFASGLTCPKLPLPLQMVQQLNLILLTTPEAIELRLLLKQSTSSAEGASLFQTLYPAWSHNPVSWTRRTRCTTRCIARCTAR